MTVFANNLEVSAKAQGCKVIAAFPDTCFTPPENPATPPGVPIPYPNFAVDSDLTSGSSTVLIGGKEISQENASKFSKVSGDEAGAAAKKGLITSKNTGKAYAQKWSMDVKVEGKGVVRFTDMATTNHMSNPGNDAPWIIVGLPAVPVGINIKDACDMAYEIMTNTDLPERFSRIHSDELNPGDAAQRYGRVVEPTTLGVGLVLGGVVGESSVLRAHSRSRIGEKYQRDGEFAKGAPDHNSSASPGCSSGEPFQYKNAACPHTSHAEARIIEDWARAGMPGTLVISSSRPVCPNCAALIKHVNCADGDGPNCNKIIVCEDNQTEESMKRASCD